MAAEAKTCCPLQKSAAKESAPRQALLSPKAAALAAR